MLIYGKTSSGRKKKTTKQNRLAQERRDFFASVLNGRKANRPNNMPDLSCGNNKLPELSNNLHVSGGFKRSVDDYKWRRGREESTDTIKEIERKKSRVAPAFNKGANQYITDGTDPTFLGRKI
jgi:hypothetical protein